MQKLFRSMLTGALLAVQPAAKAGDMNVPVTESVPAASPVIGSVIAAGGGELDPRIYTEFLRRAGDKRANLLFIPTASLKADEPGQDVSLYWRGDELNVASARILHTRSRIQANLPEFAKPLDDATGVWIGGGWQERLEDAYAGTLVERKLHDVLRRGGVVAGTSAGAAVMSKVMIRKTGPDGHPIMGKGFGLIDDAVIDQHYLKRNRQERLLHALGIHPGHVGIGIDEGTAVIWEAKLPINSASFSWDPGISVIGNSKVMVHKPKHAQAYPLENVEHVDLSILGEPQKKDSPTSVNAEIAGME